MSEIQGHPEHSRTGHLHTAFQMMDSHARIAGLARLHGAVHILRYAYTHLLVGMEAEARNKGSLHDQVGVQDAHAAHG